MKKFFEDFKKFIAKGNVMNLAVAVIIGGAFGKIVSSLVNHILMPIISLAIGGINFEDIKTVITPADLITGTAENAIYWGSFIQNVIDFLLISFVKYIIVKIFAHFNELLEKNKDKKEDKKEEVKKPTTEEILIDIKNILEKK